MGPAFLLGVNMSALVIGNPVNVYYNGPNGSQGQVAGTITDFNQGYITVSNGTSDVTIGWGNVNMAIS